MTTMASLDLDKKRVLITGGGSGIGLETARVFTQLGARVVVADLSFSNARDIKAETGALATITGDVTREEDCNAMVAKTVEVCGGLDGVIHSAAIADVIAPALDADLDTWQRIVDVSLRGTFLVCRAAGRVMLPQGSGSIVNLSSIHGLGGVPRRNAYCPSKAAVAMLTKTLASEWGSSGVRVNALAPAYIRTPMVQRLVDVGKIDVARIEKRTPMGRLGRPEEIARTCAFLVSDWASYITGVTLPVDGGWTAYSGAGDVETA